MNYFNPYFYSASPITSPGNGIFGFLKNGGLNLGTILNGTQRTLNIINQAIPVIKQMSPVVHNAKTMFRVMNEFKKVDNNQTPQNTSNNQYNTNYNVNNYDTSNTNNTNNYTSTSYNSDGGPTFFL